jgi:hypothetical protein
LFGKTLAFGACGIKIGFCSLSPDTQGVAGFFQRGDAGAGGGGELVECSLVVGAHAGDLVGCGGLGVVRAYDGGGLGLAASGGILLGLFRSGGGVGDQAASFGAGGGDVMFRAGAGLLDVGYGVGADLAYLFCGSGADFREFALKLIHASDGLRGGGVGLLAVGACLVPLGLGVPAALDFFGKSGFGGGNSLVSARAGGVHLGFGRFDVACGAQLGDGAGQGVGMLGSELFQDVDEFSGTGDAERDGLSAGFLGTLATRLGLPPAALAVGGKRVVVRVVAVFGLGAAVTARCGGGLVAIGIRAVWGSGEFRLSA